MRVFNRYLPVVLLAMLAALGVYLVVTPGGGNRRFDSVTTADGVVIDVPAGWQASVENPFRYEPPGDGLSNPDSWTVAWACGPDGCATRSLEQWREVGGRLPTFVQARADEGTLLSDLVESDEEDAIVLRAKASGGLTVVAVAVFADGADHYLECDLSIHGDPRGLDGEIIRACRSAVIPG